jgi:hypothetical protein
VSMWCGVWCGVVCGVFCVHDVCMCVCRVCGVSGVFSACSGVSVCLSEYAE